MTKPLKPIEIFRAGRHTAMSGETLSFTNDDLDQIAASYSAKVHEAPLVVGHPTTNAPAYGWAEKLARIGAKLVAIPRQLDPAFAAAVNDGRWKKVSASFFKPTSPSNPTPGKWYLRHIGFLGGAAPAVTGLEQVQFAGASVECETIEFASSELADGVLGAATKLRALLDTVGAADNADAQALAAELEQLATLAAEPAIEPEEVEQVAAGAAAEIAATLPADLTAEQVDAIVALIEKTVAERVATATGAPTTADLTEARRPRSRGSLDAQLSGERAAAAAASRKLAAELKEIRRTKHVSFVEKLVAQGRPPTIPTDDVVAFCELLEQIDSQSVSFSEAGKSALDMYRAQLERAPRVVPGGEFAAADFAAGDGSPAAIGQRAREFQAEQAKKGITITTVEAVDAINKKEGR